LFRALQSLQQQSRDDFEIIVVDNAGDEPLAQAVDAFNTTARIAVALIAEPQLGLHHARHAGVRVAQAQVLAFADDDVTFAPDWSAGYIDAFIQHPEMAAAGGPSRAAWDAPPPPWLTAVMARRSSFFPLSVRDLGPEFRLGERESFWGLNMAIRRSALVVAGGFNPELFGDVYLGDGEGGLFRKLCARGELIGYVPRALVHHHIPTSRMSMEFFRRRMANEGAAEMYHALRQGRSSTMSVAHRAVSATLLAVPFALADVLARISRRPRAVRVQFLAHRLRGGASYAWRVVADAELRQLVFRDDWLTQRQ